MLRSKLRLARARLAAIEKKIAYLRRLAATGIAHNFDRQVARTYADASDLLDRNAEDLWRMRQRGRSRFLSDPRRR